MQTAAAAAAALTLMLFCSLCDSTHTHNYTHNHAHTHNHTHDHSHGNKQQQSNETEPQQKKKNQPHIIFILTDDQGFNDIGYHNPSIKTPTLDKLASEGVVLENYYVQPICTPSRSQLLTGRYQIHTGLQHSIIRPRQPSCLPPHMDTLPQRLQEAGYSTHMVGKWHLGFYRKSCLPTRKGFDSFFGSLTGSVDYYSYGSCDGPGLCGYDLHEQEGVAWAQEGKYSTTLFTQRARKILESHAPEDRPLFLLLSLQAVHTPLTPPKSYIYPYRHMANVARRKFAAMVSTVDEAVHNVTYALRKLGLYKNSVIVYSTDNGAQPFTGGSNWPLRGRKGTYWEGGVRGVAFVHSPLLRRRRRVCRALIHITDWFPTLVRLGGGNLSQSRGLDGFDVWPTISEGKESPRREILHNIDPLHKPPDQTMKWESHAEEAEPDPPSKPQTFKKPKKKILRQKPNQKSAFRLKSTKKPKSFPQHITRTQSKPPKSKPVPGLKGKTLPKSKPIPRPGTKASVPQSSLKSSGPPSAAGTESHPRLRSTLTPKSGRTTSQRQDPFRSAGSAKSRTQELKVHLKPKSRRTVTRHLNESWSLATPGPVLQHPQAVWDTSVQAAIRVGDWKLLTGDPGHGDWVPPQVLPTLPGRWWNLERTFPTHQHRSTLHKNIWLFNITQDPFERRDLSTQRPEVVLQLLRRLAHYNRTALPVHFPPDDPRANPSLHGGAWVPWVEEEEEEDGGEEGEGEGRGDEGKHKKVKNSKKKRKKKRCRLCKLKSFFLKLNTRMMSNRI